MSKTFTTMTYEVHNPSGWKCTVSEEDFSVWLRYYDWTERDGWGKPKGEICLPPDDALEVARVIEKVCQFMKDQESRRGGAA